MPKAKQKPAKPRKDFPLGAANNGQWCRKVRGKIHYFGIWSNPDAAEAEYLRQREYLQAGRLPPNNRSGILINDLCNRFLNSKRGLVASHELSGRTFRAYHDTCTEVVDHFGSARPVDDCRPDDFESFRAKASNGRGPHAIAKIVTITRMVFGFAFASELVEKPIRFGPSFAKPSGKSMRLHRARKQETNGLRMFEASEIRQLLEAASPQMRALILLAANAGLGNTDLANLPKSAIKGHWLQFPRVKTGIDRRIPLWPETLAALELAIEKRPRAKDPADAGLCFLTRTGGRLVRTTPNGNGVYDWVSKTFCTLLQQLGMKRPGLGFYALRHGFETICGGCGDQVACSAIMGHTDNSMSGLYRETIDDERLLKAVNHVHAWLFGKPDSAE